MSSQEKSDEKPASGPSSSASPAKPPKKKFQYTKELVRIAIAEGMTQAQIATQCRVSQSMVSQWASGEKKATDVSLAPLLRRYGSRLSRSTARVYLAMADPDPRWENTAIGKEFLAVLLPAIEEQDNGGESLATTLNAVANKLAQQLRLEFVGRFSWEQLLDAIQLRFTDAYPKLKIVEVDGPVIFRYVFNRLDGRHQRGGIEPMRTPVARWALHDGLRGKFVLVQQYRRHLAPDHLEIWRHQRERQEAVVLARQARFGARQELLPTMDADWLDATDDAARWVCRVEQLMTVEELLAFADGYVEDWLQLHSVHDCNALPFLIRKALVERRYSVPGLDRITDYE